MLSERFENTKPITFIIVLLALLIGDGLYLYLYDRVPTIFGEGVLFSDWLITLVLLSLSLFFLHQIDRWNELTETKNCYSIAFFSIFMVLFPYLFSQTQVVAANLFIIAAIWRALTLKTGEGIAQKLFDTSLLIVCAGLLHPWALVFLLNIWISLLFYGAQKRRFWFIPLLAILIIALLLGAVLLLLALPFPFDNYYSTLLIDMSNLLVLHSYPLPTLVSLISLMLLLVVSLIVYYFRSKYHSISSLVVVQFLWVSILVVFLSKEIIYCFAPIAILFALYVEKIWVWWLKETILWVLLALPAIVLGLHFITKS
jgi:putative membrane protein